MSSITDTDNTDQLLKINNIKINNTLNVSSM